MNNCEVDVMKALDQRVWKMVLVWLECRKIGSEEQMKFGKAYFGVECSGFWQHSGLHSRPLCCQNHTIRPCTHCRGRKEVNFPESRVLLPQSFRTRKIRVFLFYSEEKDAYNLICNRLYYNVEGFWSKCQFPENLQRFNF